MKSLCVFRGSFTILFRGTGMKKFIALCFLFLSVGLAAQNKKPIATASSYASEFINEVHKNNIPYQKLTHVQDEQSGYYLVINGITAETYLKTIPREHKEKIFKPGHINDTVNGLVHNYIHYYPNWPEAVADYGTLTGQFKEEAWILHIDNSYQTGEAISLDEVTYELLTRSVEDSLANAPAVEYQNMNSDKALKGSPTKNRLLLKADEYFEKMWYAEAAALYEEALEDNPGAYSYPIVQKAADAHYFNTNMERAHHWYAVLYENYAEEMTADNIFKYAHSLKGNGKYAKSKRLMALYNQKTLNSTTRGVAVADLQRNEVVLDKILNTKANAELKNLALNSEYSDFSPMFYNTEELVFSSAQDSLFINTRQYKWTNQPYLDLYVAQINEESQETRKAVKFSKEINSKYHEASVTFSADNSTMYFTRNNYGKKIKRDKNGINHLKIYKSIKIDGEWTEATELPFNSDAYSTGHPALSPDGKKLYFVSDMPGSLGMTDIFVVDVLPDGTYSAPKNLGPEINTEKKEMFPFINDTTLYFSSDGHVGLGGLDIFESQYTTENGFSTPTNLGLPINSQKDDFSYIVNEATQKGFFASNREGGKGDDDIYSFSRLLPEETAKNAVAGVITALVPEEDVPIAMITLLDENNIKLKEMYSAADGSFVFEDLESNTKYTVHVASEGYETETRTIETAHNKTIPMEEIALRKLHNNISVEKGIRKFKTENILFGFDKFNVTAAASSALDELVSAMKDNPEMVIKIESHTDSRGNREYNTYLSDKRAKASKAYLVSKGIDESRIESAIGYGEDRLLNTCDGSMRCTEDQHLQNRRSEFIIVKI